MSNGLFNGPGKYDNVCTMARELGEPERIEWYCEGRAATRAEIQHSIDTGLPLLRAQADGEDGHALLDELTAQAQRWLPA